MVVAQPKRLTLEAFLQQPETKPASEYIRGAVIQKPMPKTRHSRLQGKLTHAINAVTEDEQIAYGFPELRCTFAGRSLVPDIAVLRWDHIPLDEAGEPLDNILTPPDWAIEILSPGQSPNRVTGNLLYCLQHGCKLGWLVDPGDRSILTFQPQQQPELLRDDDPLTMLDGINLDLTAAQVFDWLTMKTK